LEGYADRLEESIEPWRGADARITFKVRHVHVLTHWQDLLQRSRPDLKPTGTGTNAVLGVVDRTVRSSAEIRHIYAEIHKFAERKAGLRTVCTTLQSLQGLIDERPEDDQFFPRNILRKDNFMAGGTNFEAPDLTVKLLGFSTTASSPAAVMIAAAHVAHAGPNAVKLCPSVAAVVASTSTDALQYPGSARFQPQKRQLWKSLNDKGKVDTEYLVDNAQIVGLEEMMTERFAAWKESEAPPVIIFYRDGLVYSHPSTQQHYTFNNDQPKVVNITKEEMAAIKSAYDKHFTHSSCRLWYVLMNRNPPQASNIASQSGLEEPRPFFTIETDDATAKYMYRVFGGKDDHPQLDASPFRELVSQCNALQVYINPLTLPDHRPEPELSAS
jgi:hypothetical protein